MGETGLQARALGERVKELRCVYAVSKALFEQRDLDDALRMVAEVLPSGWQHPDAAVARVSVAGGFYESAGFRETEWRLTEPVCIDDEAVGRVEVCYLELRSPSDGDPFLAEERELLRAVAERVGETLARRRAERRLRRQEAHFRTLIENATDLILVFDGRFVIQYASPSAPTVCGHSVSDLVGQFGLDIVHPDDASALGALLDGALDEPGAIRRMELRIRHRDGGWRHLDVVGRNLLDDPAVRGILVIARDITDRKRLEDELRQAQKMEAVGRLAGGIAHDFNNLLTVIDLHNDMLGTVLSVGDPRRQEVDEIRRASRQGAALTRQLLAFSRRQVIKPIRLDVGPLLFDLKKMLCRILGEDVELRIESAPDAGRVVIDPGQLEQVLLNLVVNARDAMPAGGQLRMAARRMELGVADRGLVPGSYVSLEVSDTGTGIAADVAEHIFEPFFTTKRSGTGLGLSTVYGIVKQNGGDIRVESTPGEGSTFRILLPEVGAAGDEAAVAIDSAIASGQGNETILLVEDDDGLRRATRRVLQSYGYRVLDASGGPEALELARSHDGRIHLLLTDVVMPEMRGPDLAQVLRRDRPTIAVLLTSGYSGFELEAGDRSDRSAPESPLLEKPFTPILLVRAVRDALDQRLPAAP